MRITIGRIVHYRLSSDDAHAINRRREVGAGHAPDWPAGAQAHIGNIVEPGETYPLLVTRVWDEGPENPMVNGQVFLDGNDSLWVTSVESHPGGSEDVATWGAWHWPPRVT